LNCQTPFLERILDNYPNAPRWREAAPSSAFTVGEMGRGFKKDCARIGLQQ
jgi:hypothetical protein